MAIKTTHRGPVSPKPREGGFTLLVAVIFTSVILALAVTLGALGYKQSVLASGAIQSQYAFYAADAGLECALYADQKQNPSPVAYADYPGSGGSVDITCENAQTQLQTLCYSSTALGNSCNGNANEWISSARIGLDYDASGQNPKHCVDLTFYKPQSGATYVFSTGYNVSCATVANPGGVRFVARGLELHY